MLNPEKCDMKILQICPPRLSDVLYLGKSKKVIFQHYYLYTSDYLCYLRRKRTVIHLLTPPENATTLTCELQNFFYLTEGLLHSFKR